MKYTVTYLKSRRRMPICVTPVLFPRDYQQDLPANWCIRCRREVYNPEDCLCRRCKGVVKDDEETK